MRGGRLEQQSLESDVSLLLMVKEADCLLRESGSKHLVRPQKGLRKDFLGTRYGEDSHPRALDDSGPVTPPFFSASREKRQNTIYPYSSGFVCRVQVCA